MTPSSCRDTAQEKPGSKVCLVLDAGPDFREDSSGPGAVHDLRAVENQKPNATGCFLSVQYPRGIKH